MAEPVLFFVRHGETEWNRDGRLQGQHDSELTALGMAQAVECAGILSDVLARDRRDVAELAFVASPLKRARTTMERLRATLDLEPHDYQIDTRLAELSFGRWEGLAYPEIVKHNRELLAGRERDKWRFLPPEGESYADLLVRLAAWHATIRRDSVVVAHGGTARALVALRGIAEPEKAATFTIDQGVVYVFSGKGMIRYGQK
jgi:broad specificity phosphatase PhoE